jgi:glycine cleavage system H protein
MTNDPNDNIELTVDKFLFQFPKNLQYSDAGLWVKQEGGLLRMGMSDFAQQRNGDIAFATLTAEGSSLEMGDEIASIETVKVDISLPSPVKGRIVEINSMLRNLPELINQEPYGGGWMAVIQPENLDRAIEALMTAETYCELARKQAEAELK